MWYILVAVVFMLAGGYGGYTWGRAVEARAQALLAAGKTVAENVRKAL